MAIKATLGGFGGGNILFRAIDASNRANAEERRQQQQDLEASLKGFDYKDGRYEPNELGLATLENKRLNEQNKVTRNTAIADAFSALGSKEIVSPLLDLSEGNILEAWRKVSQNKSMLKAYQDKGIFDMQTIDPIRDANMLKEAGINLDVVNNDEVARDATLRGLVKIKGVDGKYNIVPNAQILQAVDIRKYANVDDYDTVMKRMNDINSIFFGRKVLTQQQEHNNSLIEEANALKAQVSSINNKAYLQSIHELVDGGLTGSALIKEIDKLDTSKLSEADKIKLDTAKVKLEIAEAKRDNLGNLSPTQELAKRKLDKGIAIEERSKKYDPYTFIYETIKEIPTKLNDKGKKVIDRQAYNDMHNYASDIQSRNFGDNKSAQAHFTKINIKVKESLALAKTASDIIKLTKELDKEQEGTNLVDTAINELRTYYNQDPSKRQIDYTKLNSRLGKFIASYIKLISGTAASKEEVNRLTTVIAGNKWKTGKNMINTLDTFLESTLDEAKLGQNNLQVDAPAYYMDNNLKLSEFEDTLSHEDKVNRALGHNPNPIHNYSIDNTETLITSNNSDTLTPKDIDSISLDAYVKGN